MPVEFEPYKGTDTVRIASEVLFRGVINTQNAYRDNIRNGAGAEGSHGHPFVDTSEAVNDITIEPQGPGELEYVVGGDVIQLFIAEFGRRPGAKMPPFEPIARWAERKGILSSSDTDFENKVWAIRAAIKKNGLKGFAPARKAFQDTQQGIIDDFKRSTEENINKG